MDNAKHTGMVVALGMPPPNKLKKAMAKDESESDAEAEDESDSASMGGPMALADMWAALKSGDKETAFDAFCDAMKIAKAKHDEGEY